MLSTFSVLSFFELDHFNYRFRVPGKILSEILVRTIFCYLVTPKTCQESKNDSLKGLAQKMTKLRNYWADIKKAFNMQQLLLKYFSCKLEG